MEPERIYILGAGSIGMSLAVHLANGGRQVTAEEVMRQIFAISERSDGQFISTLQNIQNGRETEIEALNLEIARIASTAVPEIKVNTTRALGELVKIKSEMRRREEGG